ncbi:MAG: DUF3822 family protein [Bacteroidota bacterium]|nr:DUF3822 family protein [Bacteroidota bacterium]
MGKNTIAVKFSWETKGLKPADLEKSSLCLELGNDFLNYAIFSANKEPLILKSLQSKQFGAIKSIDSFIEQDELLAHTFQKVFISLQNVSYTLVPKAFYKEEEKDTFIRFNSGAKKDALVFADDIKRIEAKLVYAIAPALKKSIDKHFPNHHTKAAVSLIIETALLEKGNPPAGRAGTEIAYLNFKKDSVDLVLCNEKPVFCNSFSVISPEDLLYFVLAAFEQNNFNPASAQLVVTGETETNSLWIKLLKKYIKHISFAVIDKQFKKPLEIPNMPAHYYFHLLNLIHCE